mmetsp:Transcript_164123/g.315315  ORF Transcript_164123/g.315315 Transcript_164123/m.315315 type:complete len:265 (-) Transcript_164123:1353-2147(-)
MSLSAETPKHTQLYGKLSAEQQEDLGKAVVEKLRSLIGGYGELSVLAEYIAVMLQSSRPPEQIQTELEAFLQESSQPFTRWLCDQIEFIAEGRVADGGAAGGADGGEALLNRAVRDAHAARERRDTAAPEAKKKKAKGDQPREDKREVATTEIGTRNRRTSRNQDKASRAAAGAVSAAAAAAAAAAVAAAALKTGRGAGRSLHRRQALPLLSVQPELAAERVAAAFLVRSVAESPLRFPVLVPMVQLLQLPGDTLVSEVMLLWY